MCEILNYKIKSMYLSEEQINKLKELKFKNEENILNDKTIYTILSLIKEMSFEKTYEYLKSKEWNSIKEIVFSSPLFKKERNKVLIEKSLITSSVKSIEGIIQCKKCSSKRVITTIHQRRRADESSTVKVRCLNINCKYTFTL